MQNIDSLRNFLDKYNIDYLETENKIEISRGPVLVSLEKYKYQTSDTIMYFGSIDGCGISTFYSGTTFNLNYEEDSGDLEIWIVDEMTYKSGCIKISKHEF